METMAFRHAGQGFSNLGPLTGFQRPARMISSLGRWTYFLQLSRKWKFKSV